jgi:hypothetical protein
VGKVPAAGRKLPLLPVAEALGELSELGGGLLEAALALAPPYVRVEIERLLPQRGTGRMDGGQRGGEQGRGGGVIGCSLGWLSCWGRWRSGFRSAWWSRMCTGRTARRWIA